MAQIPAQRMDQRLMQEGRRTRGTLYFGIGLGLAAGLLIILQAFLLAHIVDDVSFHGWNLAAVMPLLWVMLALFVVRATISISSLARPKIVSVVKPCTISRKWALINSILRH